MWLLLLSLFYTSDFRNFLASVILIVLYSGDDVAMYVNFFFFFFFFLHSRSFKIRRRLVFGAL